MTEQDQLALRLFYAVREVNGLMQSRLSETLEAWDITPQQFSVLEATRGKGTIHNSDICDLLSLSKGTVSGILNRLVTRALLSKNQADGDRRATGYTLTEEGERLIRTLEAEVLSFTAPLSADRTRADLLAHLRSMERLAGALGQK